MRKNLRLVTLTVAFLAFGGCGNLPPEWMVGGLYSVWEGNGLFGVVKVLAIDPDIVSVRWYKESFDTRPIEISSGELSLGTADEEVTGFGHLPLTFKDFAWMFPVFIAEESVSAEELEGYEIWKEAGGGAFSFDEELAFDGDDPTAPAGEGAQVPDGELGGTDE